ncbi:hypothetical protein [Mycetocola saprophilus]|uniref:hypothetical protein n=1 Tax=Mycetocola saprophilus TaxID=76636 RepID=UPI003BF27583
MRKTLATAALCAAAFTPMLAQPAFAEPQGTPPTASAPTTPDASISSLITPVTPNFIQGTAGNTQIRFSAPVTGRLLITAPSGTRINQVQIPGCTIASDGSTAECGTDASTWNAPIALTLASDGATTPGTSTDGSISIMVGDTTVSTVALSATVTANLATTSPTVQVGGSADLTTSFAIASTGFLGLTAPQGTTFTQVSDARCQISASGTTITCAGPIRWRDPLTATIAVDPAIPVGTVLTGGTARLAASGGAAITSSTFSVTVGDELAAPEFEQQLNSIWGTGIPGATVNVRNDKNQLVAHTEVRSDGLWGIDIPFAGRGNHTFSLTQTLGTGSSKPTDVNVDFGEGMVVTSPMHGGTLNGTPATFTGTGTVGATVTVAGTSRTICTTVVTENGTWSCDATFELPPGGYTVTARQSGTVTSSATVSFSRQSTVSAKDVAFTSPGENETIHTARPVFQGTGEPGSTVRVYGTSRTIGTATVDTAGHWSIPTPFDLSGGLNISAEQLPINGAAKSFDRVHFSIKL